MTANSAWGQDDTPELDRLFPIGEQTADFIAVLDRSLSMRPYWSATAAALSAFVGAMPDGDHVAFVTFDKEASNSLLIPRVLNPDSRASLITELERLGPPQRNPTDDNWNFTDLGRALATTLGEINRPEANNLTFVFLLTDFVHDPHATSRFASRDLQDPPWNALIERGRALRQGRALRSFALILPVDGRAGRDIGLVRAVLGEVPEARVDAQTLGPWFQRLAQEIHREKLATLVEADVARGWDWSVRPDGSRTLLQLRSHLERMPLNVTIQGAALEERAVTMAGSETRRLEPGTTVDFPLEISACAEGLPWWRWLLTTRRTEVLEARMIDVEASFDLEPVDELVRIGVDPGRQQDASITGEAVQTTCGAWLWLQILIVLGVLGTSAVSWRMWLRPPFPVRAHAKKVMLSGPGHSETLDLPTGRTRRVVVGNTADANVRSSLDSPVWAVTFVSRRPRLLRTRPRRGLYAYRSAGQVFYRGKEYDRLTRRWVERELPLPDAISRALPVGFQTRLIIHHGGASVVLTLRS